MLGKLYASPTVQSTCVFCALHGTWLPRNLGVEKSGFETRLNGGSSGRLVFAFPLQASHSHFSHKMLCMSAFGGEKDPSPQGPLDSEPEAQDNPVPNRMAARQLPGVYMILCLVNNKRYYGESKNVSARLSQHKSRLRRNLHESPELQRDFNLYGEENFEFSPLWMNKTSSKDERVALELEFITRFYTLCYNKFAKPDRKGPNNPFWGKKHSPETIGQISRSQSERKKTEVPDGFAINLDGIIYASISEASRQTNHSRDTLRRWLEDPTKVNCVPVDASQPREDSLRPELGKKNPFATGKRISLFGEVYESISDAARQRGCSRSLIQGLLRNSQDDCFRLNDDL
jgi:hypothetical protein